MTSLLQTTPESAKVPSDRLPPDIPSMRELLPVSNGQVSIETGTFTEEFDHFLTRYCAGQPLTVTQAAVEQPSGEADAVVVKGRASFLNVKDLPITARFSWTEDHQVRMQARLCLRDELPGPAAWIFSHSFPNLPTVTNYEAMVQFSGLSDVALSESPSPFLDSLDLFDTWCILSTHAGVDPDTGATLSEGINFVSRLRARGALGILEALLGEDPQLLLHGVIRPEWTERTPELIQIDRERPWDRTNVPGIHLQATLNVESKLGSMTLADTSFRIYSPLTKAWLKNNPSFQPVHGCTSALNLPGAEVSLDLSAILDWGRKEATFAAKCEGISVGKLAQLADLGSGDDLLEQLPTSLQKPIEALSRLELMDIALTLDLSGTLPSLEAAFFTVGFPNLEWKVWDDHFVIHDLACRIEVNDPFRPPKVIGSRTELPVGNPPRLGLALIGTMSFEGVPVTVEARRQANGGWVLSAFLDEGQTIPLNRLMKAHAGDTKAPSDLTIDHLALTVIPGQSYAISAALASQPTPWVIPIGPEQLEISDVMLELEKESTGSASGAFAGVFELQGIGRLAVTYAYPGPFTLRGTIPQASLRQLTSALVPDALSLPKDFDLTFEQSTFLIQKQRSEYVFSLATQLDGLGSAALEVRKQGGKLGFAVGVALDNASPSGVPGLSEVTRFTKKLGLRRFLLVVSSFDSPNFQFPDLAQFNNPRLASKNITLPGKSEGVMKGVNLFAEWQLDSGDRQLAMLKKLLGLGSTLAVTLQIGTNPARDLRLYIKNTGKLSGRPFVYEMGFQLDNGKLGLFLTGQFSVELGGALRSFDITTVFGPAGAFLSGTMVSKKPVKFGSIALSDIAVEMGVNWGGIPSLGIAATINTKSFTSSIAIFFDSTNPSRSLLAGSVSDLTLSDVVMTLVGKRQRSSIDNVLKKVEIQGTGHFKIAGGLAKQLDQRNVEPLSQAFEQQGITIPASDDQLHLVVAQPGKLWFVTDLVTMTHYQLRKTGRQIEASLQAQLYCAPNDSSIGQIRYRRGFRLNAALRFFGFKASAMVDISQDRGISVEAEMDKLVIGSENLFCLRAERGGGGPVLSMATYSRPKHRIPARRSPHFFLNGRLSFLGIQVGVYANGTPQGLNFALKGKYFGAVTIDLKVKIDQAGGLAVSGSLGVDVPKIDLGELGKIDVKTGARGRLSIDISSQRSRAHVQLGVSVIGQRVSIGFGLDIRNAALKDLPESFAKQLERELGRAFANPEKWAKAVEKGFVAGVNDTEAVLRKAFSMNPQDANKVANNARRAAGKAMQSIGKEFEQAGNTVGKEFEKAGNTVGKEAEKLGNAIGGLFRRSMVSPIEAPRPQRKAKATRKVKTKARRTQATNSRNTTRRKTKAKRATRSARTTKARSSTLAKTRETTKKRSKKKRDRTT